MSIDSFSIWRRVHRVSSCTVGVVAIAHVLVTFVQYREWSPEAVWFLGTGVGLLCMAVMNFAHVGLEPCAQPTAPPLRWLNWVLVMLGLAAVVAVPEPQAYAILLGLIGQALAGQVTLRIPRVGSGAPRGT